MRNLLNANYARLRQSKVFWLVMLVLAGYAVVICVAAYHAMVLYNEPGYTEPMDQTLFRTTELLGFASAIVLSLFVGEEYSSSTIRNKLVVGRKREHVYFAGFLTAASAVLMLYIVSTAVAFLLGSVLFSASAASMEALVTAFLTGGMMCVAYGAIYYFIAMTCSNRTWTAIALLLLTGALLLVAIKLGQALAQEEFVMQLVPAEFSTSGQAYTVEGVAEDLFDGLVMETVPNPNYLTGMKRELVQFLYDLNPAGQSLQLIKISEQNILHPVRIILLDGGLCAAAAFFGTWLFRRKDIK